MSLSRKFVVTAAVMTASLVMAIAFAGVASGAGRAPAIPTASLTVQASPGHVATEFMGGSCGGFVTVTAYGQGGGYGQAGCGSNKVSASALPLGGFNEADWSLRPASFACQANAQFASKTVTVVCTEGIDD
jgi:hypothetical protein